MTERPGASAIELCAGMGGIGIGLRALGFEIVRAFDSWSEAVAVYNHNAGREIAECRNLRSADGWAAVADAVRRTGGVELLAAGPPCKGFSQLLNGQHDGRNGHNRLLHLMPEYVALIRPRLFIIENVPDLVRHRSGRTLNDLLERLRAPANRLRYTVQFEVYDAALFGTPQARRRIIIVGARGARTRLQLPPASPDLRHLYAALRHHNKIPADLKGYEKALADPDNLQLTTASQALSDLPVLGPGEMNDSFGYESDPRTAYQRWARRDAPRVLQDMRTPRVTPKTEERLNHIPPGGCARSIPKAHLNGLSRRYDSAYRRLHPGAPSTALSTKYDCVYHYAQQRALSVREYARLQGIPDRITFPENLACRRSAYEMIGNSVPPPLIEGVLREILESSFDKERA